MTPNPAGWLALLEDIADRADAIALHYFGQEHLGVSEKEDRSSVTEADLAIEQMARQVIDRREPGLGVYGEEQGETSGGSDVRLIIDPIDATQNFMRGIPIFATLLAIEIELEIVAGVISAPALNKRWRAARSAGAYCGAGRLHVSQIARLADAQLLHGDIGGSAEPRPPDGLFSLAKAFRRTRGFGDFYQHALVAEGAAECAIDPGASPWDIAPLQILVEEAGGRATTAAGERTIYGGSLITSNGRLHDEVLSYLERQK